MRIEVVEDVPSTIRHEAMGQGTRLRAIVGVGALLVVMAGLLLLIVSERRIDKPPYRSSLPQLVATAPAAPTTSQTGDVERTRSSFDAKRRKDRQWKREQATRGGTPQARRYGSPSPDTAAAEPSKYAKAKAYVGRTYLAKVVGVTDGDTINVLIDGEEVKVRLDGIDAPEKKQAWGSVAKQALSEAIFGKVVLVRVTDSDRYARLIGRIYTRDGEDVNRAMVAAGLAWQYVEYNDEDGLAHAQGYAEAMRLGLWADRSPVPPWEYRKASKPQTATALARSVPQPRQRYTPPPQTYAPPARAYTPPARTRTLEQLDGYGAPSEYNGRPKTKWVDGYTKKDGTKVRGYWRSE